MVLMSWVTSPESMLGPDSNIAIGEGAIAAAGDVYININNHPISNKVVDEESSIGTEDNGLIESNQSFSSSKKLEEMRTVLPKHSQRQK